jgi:glutamine---fructose-6-phosphate transaminase (isomerizing)
VTQEGRLGDLMSAEIGEQPEVIRRLIARRPGIVRHLTSEMPDEPRGVVLVARGSSDNAAIFGRYAIEISCPLPVMIAAPSLISIYRAPTDYRDFVAIAISQSGETPEIVTVLEHLQRRGARGIAVTNREDSPLAETAHVVIGLEAGQERAVPATKTFTAQLAIFGFLAEALGAAPWAPDDWHSVPPALDAVLRESDAARRVAETIGEAPGIICVGRGFLFPIALEAALKLKETSLILAEGFSAADLRHGPIAVVEKEFPVLVFVAPGPTRRDVEDLIATLRARGARTLIVGNMADADLPVPGNLPEALSAIPAAVQAQLVALWLARHRGLDPDRPAGLDKVTHT